jgi:hypothetical protein
MTITARWNEDGPYVMVKTGDSIALASGIRGRNRGFDRPDGRLADYRWLW